MGYVLICSDGKRARVVDKGGNTKLTPYFEYPGQALNYIVRRLGNSPAIRIHKVGGKAKMGDEEWLIKKLEREKGKLKATPDYDKSKVELLDNVIEFVIELSKYKK